MGAGLSMPCKEAERASSQLLSFHQFRQSNQFSQSVYSQPIQEPTPEDEHAPGCSGPAHCSRPSFPSSSRQRARAAPY